jgi:hypothetical protein
VHLNGRFFKVPAISPTVGRSFSQLLVMEVEIERAAKALRHRDRGRMRERDLGAGVGVIGKEVGAP